MLKLIKQFIEKPRGAEQSPNCKQEYSYHTSFHKKANTFDVQTYSILHEIRRQQSHSEFCAGYGNIQQEYQNRHLGDQSQILSLWHALKDIVRSPNLSFYSAKKVSKISNKKNR
jgi:hypothetical protein